MRHISILSASLALSVIALAVSQTGSAAAPAGQVFAEAEAGSAADGEALGPYFSEMSALPGFESGGLGPDKKTLEFYWHGTLSQEAAAVVERAQASGRTVRMTYVRHTYDEVRILAVELVKALEAEGISVWGFGPTRDNSKIEVMGPELSSDPKAGAIAADVATKLLPNDIEMAIVPNDANPVTFEARHSDSGLPTVGGQINPSIGGACTGGLGVTRPGVGQYLLTAAHCFNFANSVGVAIPSNNYSGYSTFVPTLFGSPNTATASGYELDAALVSYVSSGNAVEAEMFLGSNTTSSKVYVDGTGTTPYGVGLCSSGSATGLRCSFERDSQQVRVCIEAIGNNACIRWADIIPVSSTNGTIMFGKGDSGGPIFYVDGNNQRIVVAIVEGGAGSGLVQCGSANYYGSTNVCSVVDGRVTALWTIKQVLSDAGYTFTMNTQ